MKIKSIAWLLCLVIVAGAFAACGNEAEDDPKGTDAGDTTTAAETDPVEERLTPDLPDVKLDGYEFNVLTKGTYNPVWFSRDIYAEKLTGETINDAVYRRNQTITEQYDFKIVEHAATSDADILQKARTALSAGTNEYSMLSMRINGHLAEFIGNGQLIDLNEVPHIDLTKPYYDQNSIKSLSLGGKIYTLMGDMLIMDKDATRCVLFNKQIQENIDVKGKYGTDMYGLVYDGRWTLDTLAELAVMGSNNLTGGQTMTIEDQFGFETEAFNTLAMIISSGEAIIKKDANDYPYYALNNERVHNIITKAVELQRNREITAYYQDYTNSIETLDKIFTDGRGFMYMTNLVGVTRYRAMEGEFGILPHPKYDEEQKEYYSPVSTYGVNSIAIPITATDEMLDSIGIIIEALSCESRYTLRPAYYDVALKYRDLRDEDSSGMLDIIFEGRVFGLGYAFNWGGVYSKLATDMTTNNNTSIIVSTLTAVEPAVKTAIDAVMKKVLE